MVSLEKIRERKVGCNLFFVAITKGLDIDDVFSLDSVDYKCLLDQLAWEEYDKG